MPLPQVLQANEVGAEVYKEGVFQGYEDVRTLSPAGQAELAERDALAKADELIDAIDSLAKAKVFLKRLCARLIKNGVLP